MVKSPQMISFPSSIKVGSQDIYVRLVPGLSDLSDDEGCYDGRKQLISFDKDIIDKSDPYALLLVWHELDHVIFEQHLLKSAEEEVIVNAFSHGQVQILRDNPQLKKWMDICLK